MEVSFLHAFLTQKFGGCLVGLGIHGTITQSNGDESQHLGRGQKDGEVIGAKIGIFPKITFPETNSEF